MRPGGDKSVDRLVEQSSLINKGEMFGFWQANGDT